MEKSKLEQLALKRIGELTEEAVRVVSKENCSSKKAEGPLSVDPLYTAIWALDEIMIWLSALEEMNRAGKPD